LRQEFLERVPGCPQEIDVTPLTSELEDGLVALPELCRGDDGDLVVPLDVLGEEDELCRGNESGEVGVGWDVQVGFERNVVLKRTASVSR
jgi:hypothetical protein